MPSPPCSSPVPDEDQWIALQRLVLAHLSLADAIARGIHRHLPPFVELDDITQEARLGLVQAAARYDDTRPVEFSAFARLRIKGAITDSLRREDPLPRQMRTRLKAEGRHLRTETLPLEAAARTRCTLRTPEQNAVANQHRRILQAAIPGLSRKLQTVLAAYYWEELTLNEIGDQLGVSQAWISALRDTALRILRERFQISL